MSQRHSCGSNDQTKTVADIGLETSGVSDEPIDKGGAVGLGNYLSKW